MATEKTKDEGAEGDDLSVFQHSVREFDELMGIEEFSPPWNSYGHGATRLHMALRWFFYTKEAPE
jgi:hypothetical protein